MRQERKGFKVLAITQELTEIMKWFDTKEEAEDFAKKCEEHECFDVHVRDFR